MKPDIIIRISQKATALNVEISLATIAVFSVAKTLRQRGEVDKAEPFMEAIISDYAMFEARLLEYNNQSNELTDNDFRLLVESPELSGALSEISHDENIKTSHINGLRKAVETIAGFEQIHGMNILIFVFREFKEEIVELQMMP